jgi:uncharacterized membrane protein
LYFFILIQFKKDKKEQTMFKFINKIFRLSILFFVYHIYSVNWVVLFLPSLFFSLVGCPEHYALAHIIFYTIFGLVFVYFFEYCLFQNKAKKDRTFFFRKYRLYRTYKFTKK